MIYKYSRKQEKIIQYLFFTYIKKYCKNRQDLQIIINMSHNRHHLMRIFLSYMGLFQRLSTLQKHTFLFKRHLTYQLLVLFADVYLRRSFFLAEKLELKCPLDILVTL